MDNIKYLIICTGYNGSRYIKKCYRSLLAQTYQNFYCILIDDGSRDESKHILFDLNVDDRFEVHCYHDNKGAAYRRYHAIKNNLLDNEKTVVCLLGMDDELKPHALEVLNEQYKQGKWMTYGNWIDNRGNKLPKGFLQYSDSIHSYRDYRKDTYRATALNTFKKSLFENFTEKDFQYKGEWIRATTESNLMFSLLEMCGREKIGVISEPIYVYNKREDNTRNRNGSSYQEEVLSYVKNLPKRNMVL